MKVKGSGAGREETNMDFSDLTPRPIFKKGHSTQMPPLKIAADKNFW